MVLKCVMVALLLTLAVVSAMHTVIPESRRGFIFPIVINWFHTKASFSYDSGSSYIPWSAFGVSISSSGMDCKSAMVALLLVLAAASAMQPGKHVPPRALLGRPSPEQEEYPPLTLEQEEECRIYFEENTIDPLFSATPECRIYFSEHGREIVDRYTNNARDTLKTL